MVRRGLVAVGLTTLDISIRPVDALPAPDTALLLEGAALMPAGTAGGCTLVAATLGLPAALVSAVGCDPQGRLVRLLLEERGVDISMLATDPDRPTSTTILPVRADGQRPNLHLLGASMAARLPEAARAAAATAAIVHWGAVGLPGFAADGPDFLAAARAAGAFVTCDLIAPRETAKGELSRLLPHVDLFMPSRAEAAFLTGTDDPAMAAEQFMAAGAKGCVIKLGAEGAYLAAGGLRHLVPAHRIEVVDTTSCGDAFCAGFMAAHAQRWDIETCVRFAMATAALVAQDLGTLGRLQSFEDTQAFMSRTPVADRQRA